MAGVDMMQREDVERLASDLSRQNEYEPLGHDGWAAATTLRALRDALDRAEAERDAAYAAGQEDMRERAADAALYLCRMKGMGQRAIDAPEVAHLIRALPIGDRAE